MPFMAKVLLVDDDPHYLAIIERVLSRNYRFAIKAVATEGQAWEELARDSFDLVLLDLYIDGRRSWETLKRAVAHPGGPVAIVFSCEDTRGNADYAVSLGAYTFLSKPFNFAHLKTTIDAALSSKSRSKPKKPGNHAEGEPSNGTGLYGDQSPIVSPE